MKKSAETKRGRRVGILQMHWVQMIQEFLQFTWIMNGFFVTVVVKISARQDNIFEIYCKEKATAVVTIHTIALHSHLSAGFQFN
jgi:hypothetical protein